MPRDTNVVRAEIGYNLFMANVTKQIMCQPAVTFVMEVGSLDQISEYLCCTDTTVIFLYIGQIFYDFNYY